MSRKPPAFQMYAGDFLTGTALMSNAEVGLYIRLLCLQAEHGSIPNDPQRFVQAYGKDAKKLWEAIKDKFIPGPMEGTLVNVRMVATLKVRDAYSNRQSEKGRASAIKRLSGSNPVEVRMSPGSTTVEPNGEGDRDISAQGGMERAPDAVAWPAWAGPKTLAKWNDYITYRLKQHRFRYKAVSTEQQAINELTKWFPDGPRFVAAMDHTMAKGWKYPVDPADYKYPAVEGTTPKKHNPRA